MSSKVRRGGDIQTERLAWQHVSPLDAIGGEGYYPTDPGAEGPGLSAGLPSGPRGAAGEAEHRIRMAHQQGYEEGQAAARQAFSAHVEEMQEKLARTIEEMTSLRPRYRHEAEQDVVGLALAVARRILHRELTVSPEALLGLVKAALEKVDAREVNHVRVARQDASLVLSFFEKMGLPHRIEVIADPGLVPGSVILESDRGWLDTSVDTQLAEIERGFADLVRRAS